MRTTKATTVLKATKARNEFFNLIKESYLLRKVYIIEKDGIPMVYISPYNAEFSNDNLTKDSLLLEIDKFRNSLTKTSNSVDLIREIRTNDI